MTVSTTANREQYATDGVTTAFTIHFPFFDETDVQAIFVASDGTETVLAFSTDFSITGGGGAGGTLTTVGVLANGGELTIYRDIPFTQEADYVEDDPLPADTLEGGFDRAVMRDQQLLDAQARALTFPVTIAVGTSGEVPAPEADKVLGWNSDATALENKTQPLTGVTPASIANTKLGSSTTEMVTPDGLAALWQEGAALVSGASISKPADANLGGYYTQSGNTTTDNYWAGVKGGELMEIRYTGTPTLSIAGNLLPPNNAAYAVTVGTVIQWRWDASVSKWRAVGGMKGDGNALIATTITFSAYKSANQTGIVPATDTKITFPNEEFDIGGYYDASNSRFTPPAGKYLLSASVWWSAGLVDQNQHFIEIFKNGVLWKLESRETSGTNPFSNSITAIVDSNGTDYWEIYAQGNGAGNKSIVGLQTGTVFYGLKVS